jgi:hypothetical protein
MQPKEEPASTNPIMILPSSEAYAQRMEDLMAVSYECDPRDPAEKTLNADQFRQHLRIFPEGQFMAVDTRTDQVVGITVSMRINYDPQHPQIEPWWDKIGYG